MKKRAVLGLAMILAGCLLIAAGALWDTAPDPRPVMLHGAGAFLLVYGIGDAIGMKADPARQRRERIEYSDERNIAIWNRAGAVSGKVLQWVILVASWAAVGFWGIPIRVFWAALGLCIVKSLLELLLVLRYQKDM